MIKTKYYYQPTHSSNENIFNNKKDSIYKNYLTTYKKNYNHIKISHSLFDKYKSNNSQNDNISINNEKYNTINVRNEENLVPFGRKLRELSESVEDDKKNKNLTLKCSNSLGYIERERKKRQEKILSNCLTNVTKQHPKLSTIDKKFFIKKTGFKFKNNLYLNNQNNYNENSFHNNKLNNFLYKKRNLTLYNKNSENKKYNSQKEIFTKYKIKYRNSENNNLKTIQNNQIKINYKIPNSLFDKSKNDSSTTISNNLSSYKSIPTVKNNNYNNNFNFLKNYQFNTISQIKKSKKYQIKKIPNLNLKILKNLVFNNSKKE
jgi:hypothetical protein